MVSGKGQIEEGPGKPITLSHPYPPTLDTSNGRAIIMLRGNLANAQKKGCFFSGIPSPHGKLVKPYIHVIYLGIIVFCVPTLLRHCKHCKRCLQVEQCQQLMWWCSLHQCFILSNLIKLFILNLLFMKISEPSPKSLPL